MASNRNSKKGPKPEEDEGRQNQIGVEVPRKPARFDWAEYHGFVTEEEGGEIDAFNEETMEACKDNKAFNNTINRFVDPAPLLLVFTAKDTVSILHNIHILEGGEIVGIQGLRIYSPYKEVGVKSLVKPMNASMADAGDDIPSAIELAKHFNDRFDDVMEEPGRDGVVTLKERPSFLFIHPTLFLFFEKITKINTSEALTRIIELVTRPSSNPADLNKATKLLQFLWAAENGFMKFAKLEDAPDSDEMERIQSVSTENFERAETDKINGRNHGDLEEEDEDDGRGEEPEEEKEWEEENPKTKRQKKKVMTEKERKSETEKRSKQRKKEIPDRAKKAR